MWKPSDLAMQLSEMAHHLKWIKSYLLKFQYCIGLVHGYGYLHGYVDLDFVVMCRFEHQIGYIGYTCDDQPQVV